MKTEINELKKSVLFYKILTLILMAVIVFLGYKLVSLTEDMKDLRPLTKEESWAKDFLNSLPYLS